MARTKAELQREIRMLRKKLKDHEELLHRAAIKVEQLQGTYDITVATRKALRKNLPKLELPPIVERGL